MAQTGDVLYWDANADGTEQDPHGKWGSPPTGTGVPSTTVTDETTWGITPTAGTSATYARGDHTHGTPAAPGGGGTPSNTVTAETSFGASSSAGTESTYSRGDHTHGTPTNPVTGHESSYAHANLPTADEKAALAGTSGSPGATNKYVTNDDSRNTNARTPTAHTHAGTDVTSAVAEATHATSADSATTAGSATTAASADAVAWASVSGKPSTYPPSSHDNGAHSTAFAASSDLTTHTGLSTTAHGGIVADTDARLSDARTPLSHDNTKHSTAYAANSDLTTHTGLTTTAHGGLLPSSAFSGLAKITVGTTAPVGPATGDLWIDTN